MSEFETVHRELRAAEEATRGASLGMSVAHVTAAEALWKFRDRTGPLEDDVVAAAREMLLSGAHEGLCSNHDDASGSEPCLLHIAALERRKGALTAALAALDEAACG